jgi:hypothetical protein
MWRQAAQWRLRQLGLGSVADQPGTGRPACGLPGPARPQLPALAQEAVRLLGCAGLANRFAVGDDFPSRSPSTSTSNCSATASRCRGRCSWHCPGRSATGRRPANPPLSVATPTVFGELAVDLRLEPPPTAAVDFDVRRLKMAYFPDEPRRFVGRTGP